MLKSTVRANEIGFGGSCLNALHYTSFPIRSRHVTQSLNALLSKVLYYSYMQKVSLFIVQQADLRI